MSGCVQVNIPEVDNTPIECEDIISTNCVATIEDYPYFGTVEGDLLTVLLNSIRAKVKTIEDNGIDLTALATYADDTAAGVGGLVAGKPYADTLGYLRIKL